MLRRLLRIVPPVVVFACVMFSAGSAWAQASIVGLVKDDGDSARWVVQPNSAYVPKSLSTSGAGNRFVLIAADATTQELQLLVVDPSGIVSATPWGAGDVPTDLKGITVREDG